MNIQTCADGDILIITINRPECKNAIDRPTAALLASAFRSFECDPNFNVAILTGNGSDFCAGADLKAVAEGVRVTRSITDGEPDLLRSNILSSEGDGPLGPSRMLTSKPVIAAISGYAVAGGLELAAWCDLRVADSTAVFGVFCRRVGVPLIDGGTVRLSRLIGQSRALDMILTGRAVSATEAFSFGLVNRLVPAGNALREAIELAKEISRHPAETMRADRRNVYAAFAPPLEDALAAEFQMAISTIEVGVRGAAAFAARARL